MSFFDPFGGVRFELIKRVGFRPQREKPYKTCRFFCDFGRGAISRRAGPYKTRAFSTQGPENLIKPVVF